MFNRVSWRVILSSRSSASCRKCHHRGHRHCCQLSARRQSVADRSRSQSAAVTDDSCQQQQQTNCQQDHISPLTPTVAIWVQLYSILCQPDWVTPSFVMFDIWVAAGTLTFRAERQSAWLSKITNDGLTRSGTGCFIAVPIRQQWALKG